MKSAASKPAKPATSAPTRPAQRAELHPDDWRDLEASLVVQRLGGLRDAWWEGSTLRFVAGPPERPLAEVIPFPSPKSPGGSR